MNMRWLLRLYPQAWRALYEEEFGALLDQQLPSLLSMIDIARGAVDAHLHPRLRIGMRGKVARRRQRGRMARQVARRRRHRGWMLGALTTLAVGGVGDALHESQATTIVADAPIDDIPCEQVGSAVDRPYCDLTLIDHGRPVVLPAGIGLLSSPTIPGGRCSYDLRTRTSSGVVRVKIPTARVYTLGQFCDIWSQAARVNPTSVDDTFIRRLRATTADAIHVYVGGTDSGSDYRGVTLADHELITVEIGAPLTPPVTRFDWAHVTEP